MGIETLSTLFIIPDILHGYTGAAAIDWQACMRFADSFATRMTCSGHLGKLGAPPA